MNQLESVYKSYSAEEIENILSQFLISSWGYSKVTSFSRNEKAFEMQYIYRENSRMSATTIAGQAYHEALKYYFSSRQKNVIVDLPSLETIAFNYIDDVDANVWKIQKTTPNVSECKIKATNLCVSFLNNFFSEIFVYEEEMREILDVEIFCNEFLNINGVDIPLPCHAKIDLVIQLVDDKIVIIDHKSKTAFSNEEEAKFSLGVQAITYVKAYESATGLQVDEVWFVENKSSQNRDKSAQMIAFKVVLDDDTRKLYEALLYEPLKRMLEAVNDPDYVYLINDSDNFVDKAELYEFWAKTMINEIETFNIPENKVEIMKKRQKKIRDSQIGNINPNVIKKFQQNAAAFIQYDLTNKDMTQEEIIEHVLRTFGVLTETAHKFEGYSSNTFLLKINPGVQVASIQKYRLDIANSLNVSNVIISKELVVYENKSYLGITFSKKRDSILDFEPKDLVEMKLPIGKDNFGNVIHWDLNNHSSPHALVCGATGSGKTEFLVSTIEFAKLAGVKDIIVLDTKHDFASRNINGVTILSDIKEIEVKMREFVTEMNERTTSKERDFKLIIFDEFADALAGSSSGKELDIWEMQKVGTYRLSAAAIMSGAEPQAKMQKVKIGEHKSLEENLRILLQKGRSLGFRVVAATQRASVKVITGDAKANFPVQVCFRVPKAVDSVVVLDEAGAESLSGMGDGLIKSPEYNETVRFQGYYFKSE